MATHSNAVAIVEAAARARRTGTIDWDYLATFDIRQADSAIDYIKSHARSDKPFFMSVNFMKMHNPNNPAPQFRGRTKLGDYSDAMLELDYNIGRIMDTIRAEAPDTIVIVTADNGAWQDAWPDAGTTPFRGEKGSAFEGGWRVPGLMWWPNKIPAGARHDEMMSHIDLWAILATMVGLRAPPTGEMMDTTASRSTSTTSTTAPTFSAKRSTPRATPGFTLTARPSTACATTSVAIPRSPG
jgi:arylsulfatase A-like enzyme